MNARPAPRASVRLFRLIAPAAVAALIAGAAACAKDSTPPGPVEGSIGTAVDIVADGALGKPSDFGLERLQAALEKKGVPVKRVSSLAESSNPRVILAGTLAGSGEVKRLVTEGRLKLEDKKEALAVKRIRTGSRSLLAAAGADDRGLMYALLDLGRQVDVAPTEADWFASVPEISEAPFVSVRGMVVFLHSADLEKDWYYSREYWDAYLGMLAANRWNTFDLVFSHQTPYLSPMYAFHVSVEEYPEVRAKGLTAAEQKRNLDTLKMISSMAKERGLSFTLSIWQQIAWEGKNQGTRQESMVTGLTRKNMYGYTYKALLKLLKECPAIDTIQLRINHESGIDYVEQPTFYKDSVFKAIKDCGRPVLLEMRDVGLLRETIDAAIDSGLELRNSHKYWGEDMVFPYPPTRIMGTYSYGDWLKYPQRYKNIFQVWTLGSHRLLLWGDPGFVRRFAPTTMIEDSVGFEICAPLSQKGFGNAPGDWRIFKDKDREYYRWEFERYWSFYQLFGRLTYDPAESDEPWLREISRRFGPSAAPDVAAAYRASSQVVSWIEAMATADYNMYFWPEKDMSGLINYYLHEQPYDFNRIAGFLGHVQDVQAGKITARLAPDDVADRLEKFADDAEQAIAKAEAAAPAGDKEFFSTKTDVLILSSLARYHSRKIKAASRLGFYYALGDVSLLQESIDFAAQGVEIWKKLAAVAEPYSDNLVFGPADAGHWKDNIFFVEKDLEELKRQETLFHDVPNFDLGYDFGAKPFTDVIETYSPIYSNYYSLEPRFEGVFPNSLYDSQVGFGWSDPGDLKAVGLRNVPDRLWRASNLNDLGVPGDLLLGDFVQGTKPAVFRIDLPEGHYQAVVMMTDRRPDGTDHGPLSFSLIERFGERPIIADRVVRKGELVTAAFNFNQVGTRFSTFRVKLSAAPGADYILNAFTITRLEPHIAHLPARAILPGKDWAVKATVTLPPRIQEGPKDSLSIARGTTSTIEPPERIERVTLAYSIDGGKSFREVAMAAAETGDVYAATVPAAEVKDGEILYYLEAADSIGQIVRLPKAGEAASYFRTDVSSDRDAPVITSTPAAEADPGAPIEIRAKVSDASPLAVVRLYYRPTRQNMEYSVVTMIPQGGEYGSVIPGNAVTTEFDIMYYLEAIDVHGNGVFFPNPDVEQPYVIVKVRR